MEEVIYGQFVVVADDEVMLDIERRNGIESVEVIGVNLLLNV
jgi:hypothetical protein